VQFERRVCEGIAEVGPDDLRPADNEAVPLDITTQYERNATEFAGAIAGAPQVKLSICSEEIATSPSA
jgi:hypothetical protein